jgi:hypothetical protein
LQAVIEVGRKAYFLNPSLGAGGHRATPTLGVLFLFPVGLRIPFYFFYSGLSSVGPGGMPGPFTALVEHVVKVAGEDLPVRFLAAVTLGEGVT